MPNASRPWQHVMEPIFGYILLAEKLYKDKKGKFIGSWNFGPSKKNNLKVKDVAMYGKKILNSSSKIKRTKQIYHESTHLSLDSIKAYKNLKWKTILSAKEALKLSYEWYKFYNNCRSKTEVINYTFYQIKSYMKKLNI